MNRTTKLIIASAGVLLTLFIAVTVYFDSRREAEERAREEQAKRDAAAWHEANKKDVETYRIDSKPASFKGFPGVK